METLIEKKGAVASAFSEYVQHEELRDLVQAQTDSKNGYQNLFGVCIDQKPIPSSRLSSVRRSCDSVSTTSNPSSTQTLTTPQLTLLLDSENKTTTSIVKKARAPVCGIERPSCLISSHQANTELATNDVCSWYIQDAS